MAWLILSLIILIAMGNFVDFLIWQRGGRNLKDALVDFYVMMRTEDWAGVFRYSGTTVSTFITHVLGDNIISAKYIVRLAVLSSLMTFVILLAVFSTKFGSVVVGARFLLGTPFWIALLSIIAGNMLADYISWSVAKYLFGRLSSATPAFATVLVCASIVISYLAVCIALQFSTRSAIVGMFVGDPLPLKVTRFQFWLETMATSEIFEHPWNSNISVGGTNFSIFSVSVLLPQVFFIATLVACYIIYAGRQFIAAPFALILQRMEESSKGIFTLVAGAVAAIVGIITALQKALQ
jgi:hypothetical protein